MGKGILKPNCEALVVQICMSTRKSSQRQSNIDIRFEYWSVCWHFYFHFAFQWNLGEYQVDRSNRYFGSGYRDDPYVLFLEELKSWITKTVSYIDCNLDARKILRDRVRKSVSPNQCLLGPLNHSNLSNLPFITSSLSSLFDYFRFFCNQKPRFDIWSIFLPNQIFLILFQHIKWRCSK